MSMHSYLGYKVLVAVLCITRFSMTSKSTSTPALSAFGSPSHRFEVGRRMWKAQRVISGFYAVLVTTDGSRCQQLVCQMPPVLVEHLNRLITAALLASGGLLLHGPIWTWTRSCHWFKKRYTPQTCTATIVAPCSQIKREGGCHSKKLCK